MYTRIYTCTCTCTHLENGGVGLARLSESHAIDLNKREVRQRSLFLCLVEIASHFTNCGRLARTRHPGYVHAAVWRGGEKGTKGGWGGGRKGGEGKEKRGEEGRGEGRGGVEGKSEWREGMRGRGRVERKKG